MHWVILFKQITAKDCWQPTELTTEGNILWALSNTVRIKSELHATILQLER